MTKTEFRPQNRFELDGNVMQIDGNDVTIEIVTEGPGKNYTDLLVVTVPDNMKEHVKPGTMQSFGGRYTKVKGEETQLIVTDMAETDEYYNFCEVAAELYKSKFFKAIPKEGKKQFTTVFLREFMNKLNYIGAVAFNTLSNELAPTELGKGSQLLCAGTLNRKAFSDGSGKYSTDIVLDPAHTQIVSKSQPRKFREPGESNVKTKAKRKTRKKA